MARHGSRRALIFSLIAGCGAPTEPAPAKLAAVPAKGPATQLEDGSRPVPAPTPADSREPEPAGAPKVEIDRTAFRITLPDGHVLSDNEMIGVVLTVRDEEGAWRKVRIEKIEADPRDPEITLHELSVQDPETSTWAPLCAPGPDGLARAMPLAGTWMADGRYEAADGAFNVTCTSGAIGKCVRFGYKPWVTASDGSSLWDYHQACVRMVRADYCGDGTSFTKNGTQINIFDRLKIQMLDKAPGYVLEAAWGPAGALCVHHPRVAETATLAQLEAKCPERLRGRTGAACNREAFAADPQYRLFNLSVPPK
ncbi:ADYC domain-containing protein [Nannocystis punicea]|uniref:ADYC domain-containing protein n=1 Tax=Nannocystis punicea TaxID=2995304 RepID=A0ABY7H9X5_9BACT|nr:ADYC domain-containing protein [Nannocystis poenicansa]WAS95943.1 ADYC domain-containing protein [Nannocystis poenicansa]